MAIAGTVNAYYPGDFFNCIDVKDGTIYVISTSWQASGRGMVIYIHTSSNGGSIWSLLTSYDLSGDFAEGSYLQQANLLVDSSGIIHTILNLNNGDDSLEHIYYKSYEPGVGWNATVEVVDGGELLTFTNIAYISTAIDSSGDLYVAFVTSSFSDDVYYLVHQISGVWQSVEIIYQANSGLGEYLGSLPIQTFFDLDGKLRLVSSCNYLTGYDNFAIFLWKLDGTWTVEQVSDGYATSIDLFGCGVVDQNTGDIYVTWVSDYGFAGKYDHLNIDRKDYVSGLWDGLETIIEYPGADEIMMFGIVDVDSGGIVTITYQKSLLTDYLGGIYYVQGEMGDWGTPVNIYTKGGALIGGTASPLAFNTNKIQFAGFVTIYGVFEQNGGGDLLDVDTYSYSEGFYTPGAGPIISSISPGVGGVNKLVAIGGSGFGASRSHSKVVLQKDLTEVIVEDDDVTSWADDEIEFYVPEQITNLGNWNVKVRVVDNA